MKKITAVFFDAGNTFLWPRESVGKIYAQLAKEIGYIFSSEIMDARISSAWKKHIRIKSARNFQCTNDMLITDWKQFVRCVLPENISADDFEKLFYHIYTRFGEAKFYTLASGFTETINTLKKMNIQLGLVSNWDSRLPSLLKAFNLYSLFDTLTISYEAGVEKPNTKIYDIACQRTRVLPENALMIGDSISCDVEAPESIGMTGLLYDPKILNPNWSGSVLHSWKQPDTLFSFFTIK
jgi:putative hydrolase of the HAD superfamily